MPELPVIYENPRFDAATPTLQPVINRAIRFGAVLMIEWGTLTLIEGAPRYLKVATLVIAVLVLAVHESWPWLRMRSKYWYPTLMGGLLATFIGVCTYAVISEPSSVTAHATPATTAVAVVDRRKNPLDEAGARWNLVAGLHDLTSRQLVPKCKINIIRYQLPYAEHLSDDFKAVLSVADWDFSESFATTQLRPGMFLWGINKNVTNDPYRCASAIASALSNSAQWHDRQWTVGASPPPPNSTPETYLKQCDYCIEVDIGNDPDQ